MASETVLSESAVNKSVDEEAEGHPEKTMDKVDVLKVVGDSSVLDSKDKGKLEETEIPEIKENENPKEHTLVNEGLNEEKVVDEADVSKTVDDSPVLDCKDAEIFKEDTTPTVMENEIPKEQATVNEGINIEKEHTPMNGGLNEEKVVDEADVSKTVDDSPVLDRKDSEILKEDKTSPVMENEIPKEQATFNEGFNIEKEHTLVNEELNEEKVADEADVSKTVDDSSVLDCKDTQIFKEDKTPAVMENEIPKEQATLNEGINIEKEHTLVNEGLNEEKVVDEADVSKTVDDSPVLDCKDTEIFREDETPAVMENEIPKEQATVNDGITIGKAQDEAEVSRPVDISSISDSKDKDVLKEERIEVKEIENLEIPKTPGVEETNFPKDEETELSMKEDSMKTQQINTSKEVKGNKGATEGSSKEEEIPVVPGDSSAKKQDTLEAMEKENLKEEETPHLAEKEKSHKQEINKDQAMQEKGNDEPSKVVEEDKLKNEAFEAAEVDREKKAAVVESREVQTPVVKGAESKTEDVSAAVVNIVVEKPAVRRSTHIFRNVGSKMTQMVQKMRNAITRKSSNGKAAK